MWLLDSTVTPAQIQGLHDHFAMIKGNFGQCNPVFDSDRQTKEAISCNTNDIA